MSEQVSYDVYVKKGVDQMGREEFAEAVAHFVERSNAVALKRRLVARGETVHVVRRLVHGLSYEEKERWFLDYHLIPEYSLPADHGSSQEPSGVPQHSVVKDPPGPRRSEAEEAPENAGIPWWRRWLGA